MADLVGQTKVEAYAHKEKGGLTDRAKAALELDEMLSEMEATAKQTAKPKRGGVSNAGAIQSLESVLANLTAVASSAPEKLPPIGSSSSRSAVGHHGSSSGASQFDSKTSGNLSDSINKVAKDIQARAGTDTDAVSVVSRDLAAELQRFAKADQERRRQGIIHIIYVHRFILNKFRYVDFRKGNILAHIEINCGNQVSGWTVQRCSVTGQAA